LAQLLIAPDFFKTNSNQSV